ncbi:MAG: TPM domain-containing protein, partial [Alistipes sp.]|nr:TPM domain-containing protein [Alistipes sp.]
MKRLFAITLLLLIGFIAEARPYRTGDVPNVQIENRYRFTSNPDDILDAWAVAQIDSICYDL